VDHVQDVGAEVGALEDLAALGVDDVALRVHDVVVIDDVLANVEVVAFDLGLRRLDARETMRLSMGVFSSMPSLAIMPGSQSARSGA